MTARPDGLQKESNEFETYSISDATELAQYYLKGNTEEAYRQFRLFLYIHSEDDDTIPTRSSPEMHAKFREMVSQESGISSLMIEHILNSFWAIDLQQVGEDAKALQELLAESLPDEVENSYK